jgi:hypothetical protein
VHGQRRGIAAGWSSYQRVRRRCKIDKQICFAPDLYVFILQNCYILVRLTVAEVVW